MDVDLICFYEDKEDKEYYKQKSIRVEKGVQIDNDLRLRRVFQKEKNFKYFFRTIEKHLKFVRNIYIVTNSQLPEWLNTTNYKIKILSYKNILPAHLLPAYNYSLIYTHIPYIPDLAEHFLIVTENIFFTKELSEKDFFNDEGYPYIRFRKIFSCDNELVYNKYVAVKNAINISKQYFNFKPNFFKQCFIEAFYRPDVIKCLDLIANETKKIDPKFTSEYDISEYIWSYYSYINNRATIKDESFYKSSNFVKFFLQFIINLIKDNEEIYLSKQKYKLSKNIKMFSFNRDSKTTDADEKRGVEFLDQLFPTKSKYEV